MVLGLCLSFGFAVSLLSVAHQMFLLYSKRTLLFAFIFHLGMVLLVVCLTLVIQLFFRVGKQVQLNLTVMMISLVTILMISELGLRLSGRFETSSEREVGVYYSILRSKHLDSWYFVRASDDWIKLTRKEFVFERKTNSLGLSEREISKCKSKFRIIGLGDSFTEGFGVGQDSTWLRKLEHSLSELDPFGKVETINAGVCGSDPVFSYKLLCDKLLDYAPDLVILTINGNDIGDIAYLGGKERFNADGTSGKPSPSWEWVYAASHLFRLVIHNGLGYGSYLESSSDELLSKEKATIILQNTILEFADLAKNKGFKFLLVVHPLATDFLDSEDARFEAMQSVDYARKRGVSVLDINECMSLNGVKTFSDANYYYWPIDGHFNQFGNNLLAKCITEWIIDHPNWLKNELH